MSKPSRRPQREARKQRPRNPWDRDPGVNADDPVAVRRACEERLVKLRALARRIQGDDEKIAAMARHKHDHHNAHLRQLEQEIGHVGAGNDPLLEDAHAHHLAGRQRAEQVLAALRGRRGGA